MFDRIVTNNIYKTERYGIYKTESYGTVFSTNVIVDRFVMN